MAKKYNLIEVVELILMVNNVSGSLCLYKHPISISNPFFVLDPLVTCVVL